MLDESLGSPCKSRLLKGNPKFPTSRTNPHRAETLRQPGHAVLGNRDLLGDKISLLIPLLICRALPSPEEEQRDAEFRSLAQSILGLKASQHTDFFTPLTCIRVPLPCLQTQYSTIKVPTSHAHKSYRVHPTPRHPTICTVKIRVL